MILSDFHSVSVSEPVVADMVADMVADIVVDMVADIVVDMVADIVVDIMADLVANMYFQWCSKFAQFLTIATFDFWVQCNF